MARLQAAMILIASGIAALILVFPSPGSPSSAKADVGYWADGPWPYCNWIGSTWFGTSTIGWGRTEGPASCTDFALLRLQWYDGSGWNDTGLQPSPAGVPWKQLGGSGAYNLVGTHQIWVSLSGWGYSNL